MTSSQTIPTRLLILSDTHALPVPQPPSLPSIDVLIHCGDLTTESKLSEYTETLRLLKSIPASVKLVIPGNHDFTIDTPAFRRILTSSALDLTDDEERIRIEYGKFGVAEEMFKEAAELGIKLLHEGTHTIPLPNGALLTIYASPFTPSKEASWGFQYVPEPARITGDSHSYDGHFWSIPSRVDVLVTHSPPHGILDRTISATRGGSHGLFAAISQARPRVHCFGHIHEGWGAKLIAWREKQHKEWEDGDEIRASHLRDIVNEESVLFESLATLSPGRFDGEEAVEEKRRKVERYRALGFCEASCENVGRGKTLFVNAAIQGDGEGQESFNMPWIVNIALPRAG